VKNYSFLKKIFKMNDMNEQEIREFLKTKEGKELFLKVLFEMYQAEKKRGARGELKCPSCGMMGRYGISGGKYLVFWHWDEAGLKRRWCYVGKVVERRDTGKEIVFVILERKKIWDENLEIPPNAPQSN
jgi:uncharacterized protein YrzB (UPF0473 family)